MTNDPQATSKDCARIETCATQRAWSVLQGFELHADELPSLDEALRASSRPRAAAARD